MIGQNPSGVFRPTAVSLNNYDSLLSLWLSAGPASGTTGQNVHCKNQPVLSGNLIELLGHLRSKKNSTVKYNYCHKEHH